MGVVRAGPTTVFFEKSMRRNCGTPRSAGNPLAQTSPGSHECASIVAHSSGLLPSKGAPHADGEVTHAPQQSHTVAHIVRAVIVVAMSRSLADRSFHHVL